MAESTLVPVMIVNEVLTYCAHYIDHGRYTKDAMINILDTFYEIETLKDASDALKECYSDITKDIIKSTRRDSNKRSVSKAVAKDIIDTMERVGLTQDNKTHLFVASNLDNMPKVGPDEPANLTSMATRIAKLEEQMCMVMTQKMTEEVPKEIPERDPNAERQINAGHDKQPESGVTMDQLQDALRVAKKPTPPTFTAHTYADAAAPDNDGFITPKRQQRRAARKERAENQEQIRKRKPAIIGKRQDTKLKGADKHTDIFIFNVQKEFTSDDIMEYLKDNNIYCNLAEIVSHKDHITRSFKINILYKDMDSVMEPEFWPVGIGCRRFIRKRVGLTIKE